MKKSNIIKTVVILLVGSGAFLYYYNQKNVVVDLMNIYQTQSAKIENVSKKVSGQGHVYAKDKTSLYIDNSQTVSKVNVKVGDKVNISDILVEYNINQDMNDLKRKLAESQIQLQNAKLNLENIKLPANGNELVQYNSDITTAKKNITDAESDIITAKKNITDAKSSIDSITIKISQQQLKVDDLNAEQENNKVLYDSGAISKKVYDDSVTSYKNALENINDLNLQLETSKKTLETRIVQSEYSNEKLESRIIQEKYAKEKLNNAKDKLSNESTVIQYNLQQNIIELNQITIEQITADMQKLTEKTISPISGNIVSINAVEGGIVAKGVPSVTISDTSKIIATFEVDEYDAPLVKLGQKTHISTSSLPDKIYTGTVTKISEEAIEKEDSSDNEIIVPVEITIDNIDEKLKIGYSVDIEIFIEESDNVVSVPIAALVFQDDKYYVYILKNNELEKAEIFIGLYGDKSVEVKSGLNENDIIILNPSDVN